MLLHFHKTLFPVDLPLYLLSGSERPDRIFTVFRQYMEDPSILLLYVADLYSIQDAGIRILPASLRKKRSPVQFYVISAVTLFAGENFRRKFPQMAVAVKQFFRHILYYILSGA